MTDSISKIKKICEIIYSALQLDVRMNASGGETLLCLYHVPYPESLSVYWNNFFEETKNALYSDEPFSFFWYEAPDCSLIFLDIRIRIPEGSDVYLEIGPALTKYYTDFFYQTLLHHEQFPPKEKPSIVNFFKSKPFFDDKIKNAFWISHQLLLHFSETKSFSIDVPVLSRDLLPEKSTDIPTESPFINTEINQKYEAERACRAFIMAGDSQSAQKAAAQMSDTDFFPKYAAANSPFRAAKNMLLSLNTISRTAAYDGGGLPVDIQRLHEEFAMRIENIKSIRDAEFIHKKILDSYCDAVIASRTQHLSPPVKKAVIYIYSYYEQPVTLHDLAQEIHYSEGHLSRIFQKETGKTFSTYLCQFRIDRACRLLDTHLYAIGDIAIQVGFSSYSKFSVAFKKCTGLTATEYLKKH